MKVAEPIEVLFGAWTQGTMYKASGQERGLLRPLCCSNVFHVI